jgi:competence protein ComEC
MVSPRLPLASRRAFGMALACAAGVALARTGARGTVLLAIAALLAPAAALLIPIRLARGGRFRGAALACTACAVGWGAAHAGARDRAPALLASWAARGFAEQRSPVALRGTVVDLERPDPDRVVIVLRTGAAAAGESPPPRFQLPDGFGVRLAVPIGAEDPVPWEIGDRLEATARLGIPRAFRNPGGFDYAASLSTRGVDLSGSIKSPRLVERIGRAPRWCLAGPRLRLSLVRGLEGAAGERRDTATFLLALLLGERQSLPADLEDRLKRAGVFHILALSGFNVALVAGGAGWLLRLVVRRPARRRAILFGVVLFYALVARPGGSILRATLMVLLLLTAHQTARSTAATGALATSATILLLVRPAWLGDPGFQLSYAATLGLLVGVRPSHSGAGAAPTAPESRTRRVLHWLVGQAFGSIRVSAAALAATSPLTARHFQTVTPAGLVANLAAVPLAAACLFLAVAAAPLALVWPDGAHALLLLAHPLVTLLDASAGLAARLPGGCLFVQPPSWGMVALLLVLLGAAALRRPGIARRLLFGAAVAAAALLAARGRDPRPPGRLDVVVFDVGQGDAILVRTPQGRTMLVDAGGLPRGEFDTGARVVAPALRALGVLRLDLLVVTHPHRDHLGGAPAIVRLFRPEAVWIGASGFDDGRLAPLVTAAEETGALLLLPRRGVVAHLGGVRIEVLNPAGGKPGGPRDGRSGNDESIVLRLRCARRSLLLTGDMERPAEASLLGEGRPLASEVLKVAHHGSDTSTSAPFLEAVAPRAAIVSAGPLNPWGHPSPQVLRRLGEAGVRLFRTDRDGAIRARTDGLGAWSLSLLTSGPVEDPEDLGGHRKEGQDEESQSEEGDRDAPAPQRLDLVQGAWMTPPQNPEEEAEHDQMRPLPPGEDPQNDQGRRAEARHHGVGARGEGVQHVPAVELADRQEVERGGEQPEPGGYEQGMEVNRAPGSRIEEERVEDRQEQTRGESDLPGERRRVGRCRQDQSVEEDRKERHEAGDWSRDPDVEQGAPRRERRADPDDGAEGAEEIRPRQEEGEGGVDAIQPARHVVPHLVAAEDEEGRQGVRKPGPPGLRMPQGARHELERERRVPRQHRPHDGRRAQRQQEEPEVDPGGRDPPGKERTRDGGGRRPVLEGNREVAVAQWATLDFLDSSRA